LPRQSLSSGKDDRACVRSPQARAEIERNDAQFEELKALLETAALIQNQRRRSRRRPH